MFKKKLYDLLLIIVMLSFLLTGCYSSEDRKLAEQYRKQGEINAVNYIKEKYGFDAKVISVEEGKNGSALWGGLDTTPNGRVYVRFKANEKEFLVYTVGDAETLEASDDYQMDIIENDFIEFFKNNISLDLYDYKLEFEYGGIKEYYDNNLEVILPYITNLELYYIGENNLSSLDLEKIENLLQEHYGKVTLISFENKEKCNAYKNAEFENLSLTNADMKNIYKDNELEFYQNKKTFYKYDNISNFEDEVYVYAHSDNNSYKISKSNIENLKYYQKSYSDLKDKKIEQITNAYSIPHSTEPLYIYFPKDKVNAKENEKIFFISEYYINGEKKYDMQAYTYNGIVGSVGDYYMTLENFSHCDADSDVVFALVRITN